MQKHLSISWKEYKLATIVQFPDQVENDAKLPVIIICHGFIGSRIGVNRLFVNAANKIVRENVIVVRFDFAGCGESEGNYGEMQFADFIEQTQTVLDAISLMPEVDQNKIILLGHSLGAPVALYTALKNKQVNHLALWAPVAQPFNDIINIVNRNNNEQRMSVDYQGYHLTETFFQSLVPYQPLTQAPLFQGSVLVIHGTNDEDIPDTYSTLYTEAFNNSETATCKTSFIPDASHVFCSCTHQQSLFQLTTDWLSSQLNICALDR